MGLYGDIMGYIGMLTNNLIFGRVGMANAMAISLRKMMIKHQILVYPMFRQTHMNLLINHEVQKHSQNV